jgi:hypothetical protein
MTFDSTKELLKLKLTPQQIKACRALEAQGKRFCIDYGYQNAVSMWRELNTLHLSREDKKFLKDCGIRA